MFTLYKAKLITAGKTLGQIKSYFEGGVGPVPSEDEIQDWIKAYDLINGIELVVIKSQISNGYCPVAWDKKDDIKMREFIYQVEQDPYFGTYINKREEFLKDWESDEYEPCGVFTFEIEDVEIIEKLPKVAVGTH